MIRQQEGPGWSASRAVLLFSWDAGRGFVSLIDVGTTSSNGRSNQGTVQYSPVLYCHLQYAKLQQLEGDRSAELQDASNQITIACATWNSSPTTCIFGGLGDAQASP